jgi:hypothetical protein
VILKPSKEPIFGFVVDEVGKAIQKAQPAPATQKRK